MRLFIVRADPMGSVSQRPPAAGALCERPPRSPNCIALWNGQEIYYHPLDFRRVNLVRFKILSDFV